MGGQSSQKTTQSSTTSPWLAAQPALQGILRQLSDNLGNTGLTGAESGALDTLQKNAGQASQFAPAITNFANNLLSGGNAGAESGNIQRGLSTFQNQLTPFASGSMVGNNTALQGQLDTIAHDVREKVFGPVVGV